MLDAPSRLVHIVQPTVAKPIVGRGVYSPQNTSAEVGVKNEFLCILRI